MITTQSIEQYVELEYSSLSRQVFSALLTTEDPNIHKVFNECIGKLSRHLRPEESFLLITKRNTIKEILTLSRAKRNYLHPKHAKHIEKTLSFRLMNLRLQLMNIFKPSQMLTIDDVIKLDLNKVTCLQRDELEQVFYLAAIYKKLDQIANTDNCYLEQISRKNNIVSAVNDNVSFAVLDIIYQSLAICFLSEESNSINSIYELIEDEQLFKFISRSNSFEPAMMSLVQSCINAATFFSWQFTSKQLNLVNPNFKLSNANSIWDNFVLWGKGNAFKKIFNQSSIKNFMQECPVGKEVLDKLFVDCITPLILQGVKKGLEISEELHNYLQNDLSEEQILTKLDARNQIMNRY